MKPLSTAALLAAALALAACAEKPQAVGGRASDAKPWQQAAANGYAEPGWQAGDRSSWEQQLKRRSLGQNEYNRAPAATP